MTIWQSMDLVLVVKDRVKWLPTDELVSPPTIGLVERLTINQKHTPRTQSATGRLTAGMSVKFVRSLFLFCLLNMTERWCLSYKLLVPQYMSAGSFHLKYTV